MAKIRKIASARVWTERSYLSQYPLVIDQVVRLTTVHVLQIGLSNGNGQRKRVNDGNGLTTCEQTGHDHRSSGFSPQKDRLDRTTTGRHSRLRLPFITVVDNAPRLCNTKTFKTQRNASVAATRGERRTIYNTDKTRFRSLTDFSLFYYYSNLKIIFLVLFALFIYLIFYP